jgi:hypothetical protein
LRFFLLESASVMSSVSRSILAPFALLIVACGGDAETVPSSSPSDASGVSDTATDADPGAGGEDAADLADGSDAGPGDADAVAPWLDPAWRPAAEDFGCLTDWTGVRGFFLTNLHGQIDEAVAVAEAGFLSAVPAGTIVQLIPTEAMVKLAPGALPETGDWEYLLLATGRGQTTIEQRGGAEVSNPAGTCYGCHLGALSRDYICEDSGLCSAGNVPRSVVERLVANDTRCR